MSVYSSAALRRVREEAGVSREWVAVQLGCSESSIRKYERGLRTPSASMLGRLAATLECSVGDLFVSDAPDVA